MAKVSAMSHAALLALAFHLVFLSDKHFQPEAQGADGFIVTVLSEAEYAVGSGLKSCFSWVFTDVIFRETPVSYVYVFGKFEEVVAV